MRIGQTVCVWLRVCGCVNLCACVCLRVCVCVCVQPHAMRQMLDHGVDALVTNKAELLQQAIEFRLSRC